MSDIAAAQGERRNPAPPSKERRIKKRWIVVIVIGS
jgi:hypothetical protein